MRVLANTAVNVTIMWHHDQTNGDSLNASRQNTMHINLHTY